MTSKWRERSFGELTDNFDSARKPVKEADRRPGPYPYYGASGVVDHVDDYLFDGEYLLVAEDGENLRTRKTPIAFIANGKFWVNNHAHIVRGNGEADTRFLMYALSRTDISGYLTGSTIPKLTQGNLNRVPLLIPSLVEQRKIANILGALDEKIELNRRMNETLEGIARALFKSWFVDFDPAREASDRSSLPSEIASSLSARLVTSEVGEISEGWKIGSLGDVAEHPRRGVQPSEIAPATPYLALEHMPKRCIALSEWDVADGLESNKFRFRRGEFLFGKLRPYFHKVGIAPVDGVCSTDIVVVTPKNPSWGAFVLGHLSSEPFIEYTNAGSTGTKMPRTSWSEMARYPVVLPPEDVAAAFNSMVQPMLDRIVAGIHESRTLGALRDALLPKLISGELRIERTREFVREATA